MASLVAHLVKNPPAKQETWVWSLGWEDPLQKGMATHSSILAWRIPWTGGLYSVGLQRVGHNWATNTLKLCQWCAINLILFILSTVFKVIHVYIHPILLSIPTWWTHTLNSPSHHHRQCCSELPFIYPLFWPVWEFLQSVCPGTGL